MAQFTFSLTHERASDYKARDTDSASVALPKVANFINGISGRVYRGTVFTVGTVQASGTLTFDGASGTVGGSINGVAITVTAAGGDGATGDLWASEVEASDDPLVAGLVTVSSDGAGVVTVTAVDAGPTGNTITLSATGTGVTASGARLEGGEATTYNL